MFFFLISYFPHFLWNVAKNRTKLKKLFIGTRKSGHTHCSWLFLGSCNNPSNILDWIRFLYYFWLQGFIPQQAQKLMNKQKISLIQQLDSLHLKNPLALSKLWGSWWAVSEVDSSAHAPRLPRFILLGSFSDTLLVVSILHIVYDCHL